MYENNDEFKSGVLFGVALTLFVELVAWVGWVLVNG